MELVGNSYFNEVCAPCTHVPISNFIFNHYFFFNPFVYLLYHFSTQLLEINCKRHEGKKLQDGDGYVNLISRR